MRLTDKKIKASSPRSKPYKLSDGSGMYLLVHPKGSKYWRFKYRYDGKEKLLALGVYPEITLSEARKRRDEARKSLALDKDPLLLKQQKTQQMKGQNENTFEVIANEWLERKRGAWTARHLFYVRRRLESDIWPSLGRKPISQIKAPELLTVIRAIELRGALDIAHRALQTCGQIFRYAIATGKTDSDITRDLKGALKQRKSKSHAYLAEKELPEFLEKLDSYDGELLTQLALKLLLLTFVRTSELRGATWNEIDLELKEWRIPAERMKMREQHIVPLSCQSIMILEEVKSLNISSVYLFSNARNHTKPLSENTLLYALYRMGYHSRATGHGFRATASTILNENGFRSDVIERQLAHGERNSVRASYNHAQYLTERREMMQWWGNFLDNLKSKGNNSCQ